MPEGSSSIERGAGLYQSEHGFNVPLAWRQFCDPVKPAKSQICSA
jgi:hypothetical protein